MPPTLDKHSIVYRDPTPVTADMDGELVMISIERGNYYGLGTIGSRIWQLIEAPIRVSALCQQLTTEYKVEQRSCETDVIGFLRQLQLEGLINIDHDDSA